MFWREMDHFLRITGVTATGAFADKARMILIMVEIVMAAPVARVRITTSILVQQLAI